jgi:hypothetical protein
MIIRIHQFAQKSFGQDMHMAFTRLELPAPSCGERQSEPVSGF